MSRVSGPDNGPSVDPGVDTGSGHDPTALPRLRQFAAEQAALRHVATLVAGGAQPAEVFTAVAHELAGSVGAEAAFVSPQTPSTPPQRAAYGFFDAGGYVADDVV